MKSPVRNNTPVEKYQLNGHTVWVKREDLCCPLPGPSFSKIRGVWAHVRNRPEPRIGVLDTFHSKAGWAVAYICSILGKECVNFYPQYKYSPDLREGQLKAQSFGATLHALPAGRSAILFHQARKCMDGYMMPNALKLPESIEETEKEAARTFATFRPDEILIAVSSGTIAAGVIRAAAHLRVRITLHMGYSRSVAELRSYVGGNSPRIVDEEYAYKDEARPGVEAPFPCNPYYDLKAWRWLAENFKMMKGRVLFWNIGA